PKRQAADAGIECIGCGVCHASCDIVAWNPDYLGPAALNRAWTLANDVRDGARAERLGVVDFIEKPFRVDQLLDSVEKGFALLQSQPMSRISALATLTRREKEVLVAFADGAPNKVVAHDLGLSVRTVELHRANLMKKLGVRSLSQALLIAKDGGYV
ncbi:MAG TPA: LuxR C-terminal-related transcriptional regulator, partial [Allosphingosinicella sp.]|nr:LuxR C-terminal-related transcriptional regulator [Allosphingosinicella sp.]